MFSNKESTVVDAGGSTTDEAKENAAKRKSLMSVIASLTPSMLSVVPDSSLLSLPLDAKKDVLTTENPTPSLSAFSQSPASYTMSVPDSGLAPGSSTSNTNPTNLESLSDGGGDVMSNILHLLYQVASGKPPLDDILPSENDETILSTQHAPEGKQAAFKQLMTSYANGTNRVREILGNEVNIMYECRQCRGIFRSLPNLIRHKTDYCNNTGLMSTILNRTVNSSKEDDAAFQRILDILHPPEPKAEIVSFDHPVQQKFDYNISRPVPDSRKQPHVTSLKPNDRNRYPVDLSKSVSSTASSSDVISKSGPVQSASTFGKFFIGRPTKPVTPSLIKPYSCPICKKQMVERKSVRRHLVSIHSLTVVEAYKAMSNSDHITVKPTVPVTPNSHFHPTNGTRSRKSAPSENLLRQCVEEISLGPSRTIHVLPQEFCLSSVQCPVCHRGLCRRTNVRRHLLEAHNLIIKGEKKYFQLKDIARNTTSNSPTLRRLRHLFTVTNRSPTNTDSGEKSLANPVNVENQLKNSESRLESNANNQDNLGQSADVSADSTSIDEDEDQLLDLDKIKFVESPNEIIVEAPTSSNTDEPFRSDRSPRSEVFSRNPVSIKMENETAEDLTMSGTSRKLSQEIHTSSNKPQEPPLHDDDTPEDEPPPKKLRQLAPMVARTGGQTSFNGQLIGTATQVTSSSNIGDASKSAQAPHIVPNSTKSGPARTENGVKNLIFRRVSSDGSTVPTTVASNGRTLIKVELRNSPRSSESAQQEKATTSKSNARFDIAKLACFTCDKKFKSPPDIRRHLISVHSFTTEEALATCYDCSSVDAAAQTAGLKNGFDITNAKCLICMRFYFSRENLMRHLIRTHHMEHELLQDLKLACSVNSDDQEEAEENNSKQNHEAKPPMPYVKVENEMQEDKSQSSVEKASFQVTMTDKCTAEEAAEALKYFPKQNINVATHRCLKCKHRCMKAWDFKVHLLKHLGLGFYRCKYCPKSSRMASSRSSDMVKHFQEIHGFQVRCRDPLLQECRVNYQNLWEAYDLPLGKSP